MSSPPPRESIHNNAMGDSKKHGESSIVDSPYELLTPADVRHGFRDQCPVDHPFEGFSGSDNAPARRVAWDLVLAYFVAEISARISASSGSTGDAAADSFAVRLLLSFPQQVSTQNEHHQSLSHSQRILPPSAVDECMAALRRQARFPLHCLVDRVPQGSIFAEGGWFNPLIAAFLLLGSLKDHWS